MRRLILLVVVVMLFGVVAPAQAHAASEPDIAREEVTGVGYSDYSCGFEIVFETDFGFTSWSYFNSEGNLVRYREHLATRMQTWTNPENGRMLTSTGGGYVAEWNISEPDLTTFSGSAATITVPGEGLIFQDAGRVEVRGYEPSAVQVVGGHHDFFLGPFLGEGPEGVCGYLEG